MPNGKTNVTIPVPRYENLDDETKKINRLLNIHDIKIERISDLIGKKIPIRPKGNYTVIDYPPIPTIPNNIRYKTRRKLETLGLVRWGHTVKKQSGYTTSYEFNGHTKAPSMPKSAFWYTYLFQDFNVDTTVLTNKGVTVFMILNSILMLACFIGIVYTSNLATGLTLTFIGLFFVCLNVIFHFKLFQTMFEKIVSYIKNKYFPTE